MEQTNHRERLKQILSEASSKGASQSQLEDIVVRYKSKYIPEGEDTKPTTVEPKKAQTEVSGASVGTSVKDKSSLDGETTEGKTKSTGLGKSQMDFINSLKGLKDPTSTFKDSSGRTVSYDKEKEAVQVDPRTGQKTVYKKEDLGVGSKINKEVKTKNISEFNNLPKDTRRKLTDKSSMIDQYISDKGLEGKVKNPQEIAQGYYLLGEDVDSDQILKESGINMKDFEKYYESKVREEAKNVPFYEYESQDISDNYVKGQGGGRPSFASLQGDTGEFADDNKLVEAIGDVSKYGINTKDFNNYLKKDNPRLNQTISEGINSDLSPEAFENLVNKSMGNYVKKRLDYLDKMSLNMESIGEDNSKIKEEIKNLTQGYEKYVEDNLPNLNKVLQEKREQTAKEYLDFKEGKHKTSDATTKFFSKMGTGLSNSLADIGLFITDQVGADKFSEKWRLNRDLDKVKESDSLLYAYESGKVIDYKGGKYLITDEGKIIDQDAKKDVTSIAKELGLNSTDMYKKAQESKESDYSFSAGNTAYMSGEILGGLIVQLVGTKGVSSVLGNTAKANMIGGMTMGSAVSYTNAYENAYQSLLEHGLSKGEATRLSNEIATTVGITTALTSTVAYNPKALQAFSIKENMNKFITRAIQAEAEGGKKALSKVVKDFTLNTLYGSAKEGVEEALQENLEYFSEQLANQTVNRTLGEKVLDEDINQKEIINNAVLAFASSSAMAGVGELRSQSGTRDKIELYNILSNDFEGFQRNLSQMKEEGLVTTDKADKLSKDVDNFRKYANKIPNKVPEDKLFDVIDLVAQRNEIETDKQNVDKAFHPEMNEEIKKIDEKISETLNTKTEDTNNKQEEITNEETRTKTEPEGTIETTESEDTQRETESETKVDIQETIEEINKVDLAEDLGINKVNDFLDKLDQQLKSFGDETLGMNLPVVVARGALGAMRASVKTVKTGADVVSAGINFVRNTDWYKNLNDSERKELEDKGIIQSLVETKPEVESKVADITIKPQTKKVNKSTKQVVRETTKQTDTSKKITTSESKLLKEKFKNLERGFKQGVRETQQLKKDFVEFANLTTKNLRGLMTDNEISVMNEKIASVNSKNLEEVGTYVDKLVEKLEVRAEKKRFEKISSSQKKAVKKAKTTYGNYGENIRSLASLKPEDIPPIDLDSYQEVMKNLATGNNVNFNKVDELYEKLQPIIQESIDRRYEESLNKKKEEKDNTGSVTIYEELSKDIIFNEGISDYERDVLRDLKKIPIEYIRSLPKSTLDKLNKALIRNNESGFLENKTVSDVVMKYKAKEVSKNIKEKVGDILLKPFGGINSFIDRLKGKDFTSKDFEKRFFNVMLQHIDTTIKGINGTIFYDNIVHPISAGLDKAGSNTMKVENAFSSLFNKAVQSTKKNEFDFNVELQLYFRQKEYESNPELKGKQVFSLEEHMKALEENRGAIDMSDKTFERVMDIYNKAPKKAEEMYSKFSQKEKDVIKFMEDKLRESEIKSRDVNNHVRGETLIYTKDYFPRANSFVKTDTNEELNIHDKIQALLGSTSVRGEASNLRTANKANPLRFDTSGVFMNHIKSSNIEAELSVPVKQTGITLSDLKKSENESLITVAVGLENSVKSLLDAQMRRNPYTVNSRRDAIFKTLVKKSFSRMLIDPVRLLYDTVTNYVPVYGVNIDRLGAIKKANKALDKEFVEIFNKEVNSVQAERLGGARSVDLKDAQTTSLSKSRFKQADYNMLDRMVDLFNKNEITDFADRANVAYYNIADKPAQHMWKFHLLDEFKKQTGNELNVNKYKTDADYRYSVREDLKKATAKADKLTTNLFNTASVAEQKINVQQTRNDFFTRMNSFMRSFTFNENRVFWDSFNGLFKTGTTSFESRAEALRAFGIVNIRSIAYSYMAQMMLVMLGNALGFKDDDEEANKIAIRRAMGQHGALVAFGNKGVAFEMVAGIVVERFNKMIVESEYDRKEKKYKKYDPFKHSVMFSTPERGDMGQYIGSLGAEGYALMSLYDMGDLAYKILDKTLVKGEDMTEEDWIKFKTAQTLSSFSSQMTGLPVERMGKLVQRTMNAEVKREEERKKKRKKALSMYN